MLATGFGLNSDEWNFLAVMVAALVPIYIGLLRVRSDGKKVRHEVTHNGGVTGPGEPTVKDYAKAAYDEAVSASLVADRAAITAAGVARRLTDHLETADRERGVFLERIGDIDSRLNDLDAHLTRSTEEVVAKVQEGTTGS